MGSEILQIQEIGQVQYSPVQHSLLHFSVESYSIYCREWSKQSLFMHPSILHISAQKTKQEKPTLVFWFYNERASWRLYFVFIPQHVTYHQNRPGFGPSGNSKDSLAKKGLNTQTLVKIEYHINRITFVLKLTSELNKLNVFDFCFSTFNSFSYPRLVQIRPGLPKKNFWCFYSRLSAGWVPCPPFLRNQQHYW